MVQLESMGVFAAPFLQKKDQPINHRRVGPTAFASNLCRLSWLRAK